MTFPHPTPSEAQERRRAEREEALVRLGDESSARDERADVDAEHARTCMHCSDLEVPPGLRRLACQRAAARREKALKVATVDESEIPDLTGR